jgi:hypothetical protein
MALINTIIAQNTFLSPAYPSRPQGVPTSWDWYNGRTTNQATSMGCSALAAWGQVYPIKGHTQRPFGKIETRWHRGWVHRKTGGWILAQAVGRNFKTEGGIFRADFSGNVSTKLSIIQQPSLGGALMSLPQAGYCVHWWAAPRGGFNANDVNWCYHQQDMRATDPRDQYCVQIGIDWWKSMTAGYPNNPDAGHSNWVKLTTSWQTIGMYSCTAGQFRSDLPYFLRT